MTYHANGKLLLTGEYAVVDGAEAIALPLNKGQDLSVRFDPHRKPEILWSASDPSGTWLEITLPLPEESGQIPLPANPLAEPLVNYLNSCRKLNPKFLPTTGTWNVETRLSFNRHYGWGSSSTLISLLAQWSGVSPFEVMLINHPDASGYDIAAATSKGPFLYKKEPGGPKITPLKPNYPFSDHLMLVYLGVKKSSSEAMKTYRLQNTNRYWHIDRISELSRELAETSELLEFCSLLGEHEQIISQLIGTPPVKSSHFHDFKGVVKSLGAWGGDFILAASEMAAPEIIDYFAKKGLGTCFKWSDLVLMHKNQETESSL